MNYIAHRIDTRQELRDVPRGYGVEIDVRDRGDQLILQHDPFVSGEEIEPFLKEYRHGTLIVNVKSERIEWRILELLTRYGVSDYFFLDSSFPMMVALAARGITRSAVRLSEYEAVETVLRMQGRTDWCESVVSRGFASIPARMPRSRRPDSSCASCRPNCRADLRTSRRIMRNCVARASGPTPFAPSGSTSRNGRTRRTHDEVLQARIPAAGDRQRAELLARVFPRASGGAALLSGHVSPGGHRVLSPDRRDVTAAVRAVPAFAAIRRYARSRPLLPRSGFVRVHRARCDRSALVLWPLHQAVRADAAFACRRPAGWSFDHPGVARVPHEPGHAVL